MKPKTLLCALLAIALLAGCSPQAPSNPTSGERDSSSSSQESSPSENSTSQSSSEGSDSSAQLPNPMVEYETPDFANELGFSVVGYPETEDITLEKCWVIGGALGQLDFNFAPDVKGTLRVAKDSGEDISGVYVTDWEETSDQELGGVTVHLSASAGGPALATWQRNGYAYSLYFKNPPMGLMGGVLESFVTGTDVRKVNPT